jgi:hypothetical protein
MFLSNINQLLQHIFLILEEERGLCDHVYTLDLT